MPEGICITDGCGGRGKLTRGMCGKCYRYWLDHTPKEDRPVAPRFARDFWDYVKKTHEHGCWLWTGPRIRQGYGGWGKKLAHRHSWELANGSIPEGLWILHHCDNPPCVNPAHLYPGTVVENVRDAVTRGRNYCPPRKTHCPSGHPYSAENTYMTKAGTPQCKECTRKRSRERQRRLREVARSGDR